MFGPYWTAAGTFVGTERVRERPAEPVAIAESALTRWASDDSLTLGELQALVVGRLKDRAAGEAGELATTLRGLAARLVRLKTPEAITATVKGLVDDELAGKVWLGN